MVMLRSRISFLLASHAQNEIPRFIRHLFYETAAADGFFGSVTPDSDPYYNRVNGVIYPFGYGLSYTSFSQAIREASYGDGNFTFTVDVTNIGGVAGKDVVELYVETPYTPGGIEKAKVVLCGFDKTQVLNPSETETVTITVKQEDIASYDDQINKSYVLDAGDYTFYLGTVNETVYGSHAWAYATPTDSKALTGTDNAVTFAQPDAIAETVIYNDSNNGSRASDNVTATNAFEEL